EIRRPTSLELARPSSPPAVQVASYGNGSQRKSYPGDRRVRRHRLRDCPTPGGGRGFAFFSLPPWESQSPKPPALACRGGNPGDRRRPDPRNRRAALVRGRRGAIRPDRYPGRQRGFLGKPRCAFAANEPTTMAADPRWGLDQLVPLLARIYEKSRQ